MKLRFALLGWVLGVTAFLQAQDSVFTYQGRLLEGGQPADGDYVFEFQLYADESGDTAWGDPVVVGPVAVSNGLFTALVDLGSAVAEGSATWLGLQVRTNQADASYVTLSPRQPLTAVPRALSAQRADSATLAASVAAASVTGEAVAPGSLQAVHLAANEVVKSLNGLRDDVVLQAGLQTAITPSGSSLTIHNLGWGLAGNAGTDPATDYLGTTDSAPLEFRVNNRRVLRLATSETNGLVNVIAGYPDNGVAEGIFGVTISGGGNGYGGAHSVEAGGATIGGGMQHRIGVNAAHSVIGGGVDNSIGEMADQSVIAGGGAQSIQEQAARSTISGGSHNTIGTYGYYSTIGGGWTNTILAHYATIAGGVENTLGVGAQYASIGGGSSNRVEGSTTAAIAGGAYHHILSDSRRSTISGGAWNRVEQFSPHASIGGGLGNVVGPNAEGAVVPGGISNRVDGAYGLAAGRLAHAAHRGAWVWADALPWVFPSAADNEVALRATGGVRMVTAVDKVGLPTAGVSLPAGSGSWESLSDRAAKADFEPVDPAWVLEQVAQLPVERWRYRAEADAVRHVGPTAQDFHSAFGLGSSDRTIAAVDADGVALAAIQALYRLVQEQQAEIRLLRDELEAMPTRRRSPRPDAGRSMDPDGGQTPEPQTP